MRATFPGGLLLLLLVTNGWALQLDDRREQILAQYGAPTSGELPADRGMGTYKWSGWRLDVEIMQGMAQRLIFTKDAAPFSEAEARQLLNENGGTAAWQVTDHVAVDALAANRWRRASDGAEAFTVAGDGRVMCLATRSWAEAWTKAHAPVVATSSQPDALSQRRPSASPTPAASLLVGFILLAGLVGFVVFLVQTIVQAQRRRQGSASTLPSPLWSKAAMEGTGTLATPPLPPSSPPPLAAQPVAAANVPKSRTLADLSWQEFELVTGELYRRQGYAVELRAGDGADGGVDLRLRRNGQLTLVQCKHWKAYKVGVSTVRELFGILSAEKADQAILVTTGRFTPDAEAFATGKPLELIDGLQLPGLVEVHRHQGQGDLLDVASWCAAFAHSAKLVDPVCPRCHSSMVQRVGRQSGQPFWGCSTYPRCRGKRNVRLELISV